MPLVVMCTGPNGVMACLLSLMVNVSSLEMAETPPLTALKVSFLVQMVVAFNELGGKGVKAVVEWVAERLN